MKPDLFSFTRKATVFENIVTLRAKTHTEITCHAPLSSDNSSFREVFSFWRPARQETRQRYETDQLEIYKGKSAEVAPIQCDWNRCSQLMLIYHYPMVNLLLFFSSSSTSSGFEGVA